MTARKATTLYRPTGEAELTLVAESDYFRWPPRLPEQPIFYPVANERYAIQIARDWNAEATRTGFVTAFEVDSTFLDAYDPQIVGNKRVHVEYWIPAEDLDDFNSNIIGRIRVVGAYRGDPPEKIPANAEVARILAAAG